MSNGNVKVKKINIDVGSSWWGAPEWTVWPWNADPLSEPTDIILHPDVWTPENDVVVTDVWTRILRPADKPDPYPIVDYNEQPYVIPIYLHPRVQGQGTFGWSITDACFGDIETISGSTPLPPDLMRGDSGWNGNPGRIPGRHPLVLTGGIVFPYNEELDYTFTLPIGFKADLYLTYFEL